MDVGALFIANSESAELIEPGESSFGPHRCLPGPPPCLLFRFASKGYCVAGPKISPDRLSVITTVANQAIKGVSCGRQG